MRLRTGTLIHLVPLARVLVRYAPSRRLRTWAWNFGYWRIRTFTITTQKFRISGCTRDLIQRYLYWFGVWEPQLTRYILERMKRSPGRLFIDVGANIGYFSLLVARNCPSCRVVAIEAYPPTIAKLRHHIKINNLNNVRIIPQAVADTTGTLELYYAGDNNQGATSMLPTDADLQNVKVPCAPLPQLITAEELPSVRLIKIDVEGAEGCVVRGLGGMLSSLPADAEFMVELSGSSPAVAAEVFEFFRQQGFWCYQIYNDYSASAYLNRSARSGIPRLNSVPQGQADVIFSRSNQLNLDE